VKELGKNQQKLKHLKLDLSYCRLPTDEPLQMIGKEIGRRLHDLQSFTLILGGLVSVSKEAIEIICYGISKYQIKLKKLCLGMRKASKLDDGGLKIIADAITKRFDQLEWLDLDFSL